MSRIYDALRRFEQEKADRRSGGQMGEDRRQPAPAPTPETPAALPQHIEHLTARAGPENHVVAHLGPHESGAEKFRVLRHRLQQLRHQRPVKKILVTSGIPKEGKTLTAINLAASLALASPRVLLIDADLRSQSIHHVLGLEPLPGLAEVLAGQADFLKCLRSIDPLGIYYLPAGRAPANPVELLQGRAMKDLMARATALFDWVVIDSPPLNPFADAHCLATVADEVLLVLRFGLTPRAALQQALEALNGVRVAGVLLNDCDETRHDGYYYYAYGASPSGQEKGRWAASLGHLVSQVLNRKVFAKWFGFFTRTSPSAH